MLESYLSPDEKKEYQKRKLESGRWEFLLSRIFRRAVIADYLKKKMSFLRFGTQPEGKPFGENFDLQFNTAHTDGIVALSLSRESVGVDVEKINPTARERFSLLAQRYFSPEEYRFWQAQPEALKPGAFLRLFTLKEAHLKALGCGLRFPLDRLNLPRVPEETFSQGAFHYFSACLSEYHVSIALFNPGRFWTRYRVNQFSARSFVEYLGKKTSPLRFFESQMV